MRVRSLRFVFAATVAIAIAQSGMLAGQGATPAAASSAFGPQWRVLIGEWAGDGGGQPGSAGRTSYRFEVGERAIVRRNRADVAASAGRPASVHEDLLVIYSGAKPGEARALYVDNEDHVIQYSAAWSADGMTLTFVSDVMPTAPRFRMTYKIQSADEHVLADLQVAESAYRQVTNVSPGFVEAQFALARVAGKHVLDFDIAPPGSPDGFRPYVSGKLKRLQPTR